MEAWAVNRSKRLVPPVPLDFGGEFFHYSQEAKTRNRIMLIDLASVVLVLFAAMAWGANTPWAIAVFSAGSLLVLAWRLIWDAWRGQLRLFWSWLFLPAFGLLALIGLQQLSPRIALDAPPGSLPHTVEPHTTGLYFLLAAGYVALGFSVVHGFRSRKQLYRLMVLVIGFGVFESLYGLVQSLGGVHYIWTVPFTDSRARGTLMNPNHYALLLNLAISVGVGYLYTRSVKLLWGRKLNLRRLLGMPDSARLAWIVVWLALIGFGVFASLSRTGTIAMFVCFGGMLAAGRLAEGERRRAVIVFSVLFAIVSLGLYVGVEGLLERYASILQLGYFERDRIPIWRDAWPMVSTTLWFGKGLGSFMWTFPAYETMEPDIPAMYAHNDYLQVMAEIGIVGFALLIWAGMVCLRTARRNLLAKDHLVRGIGLSTLGVLAATAIQEITDYSLYIPGIAAMFILLIALNERAAHLEWESPTASLTTKAPRHENDH
jgi:O-antigen ligase